MNRDPAIDHGHSGGGLSKEKKQLFALGGLGVVLVGVLVVQFGGEAEPDPGAPVAPPVAQAQTAAQPGAVPAIVGAPAEPNDALLGEGIGVRKNPCSSFWQTDEPAAEEPEAPLAPPPAVTVNGTLTSGKTPIAIINGQVHHLGDVISGWTLVAIDARSVRLRSPGGATLTADMPLLPGSR
jgi:hypothetical protein